MDNVYHALIMAGSVLLFLIGVSVAIYNYSNLLEVNDRILTNSEYYDRNVENFQYTQYYTTTDGLNTADLKRIYDGAQVANMILNMYMVKTETLIVTSEGEDNGTQMTSQDISYNKIEVDGEEFTKSDDYIEKNPKLVNSLTKITQNKYVITAYDLDHKTVVFKNYNTKAEVEIDG